MDLTKMLNDILSVGGIARLIALIIATSICLRYVQVGAEEIPNLLEFSLTAIIGFYFGAGVSRVGGSSKNDD